MKCRMGEWEGPTLGPGKGGWAGEGWFFSQSESTKCMALGVITVQWSAWGAWRARGSMRGGAGPYRSAPRSDAYDSEGGGATGAGGLIGVSPFNSGEIPMRWDIFAPEENHLTVARAFIFDGRFTHPFLTF